MTTNFVQRLSMGTAAGIKGREPTPDLVLASASEVRARLLEAAGVAVTVEPAAIDEESVKRAAKAAGDRPGDVAQALADAKASARSRARPDAYVIGADQLLVCDGRWFDKPGDAAEARQQLRALRGRWHELHSAVGIARAGGIVWRHSAVARLTMRDFSDAFLDDYLDRVGDAVLRSVGCYELEGVGAQLFSSVEGDYFAILGVPLLPVLGFLRERGLLAT